MPLTLPQLLGLFYAHTKELNFGHGPVNARVAITNAIIIGFSMVRISNSISIVYFTSMNKSVYVQYKVRADKYIPIERYWVKLSKLEANY